MDYSINVKFVKVLEPQSGTSARGNWKKQNFIVETIENYPKKICLVAWNERTEILKSITPGDELKISFSIESREYNERWYTDVKANDIVKVSQSSSFVEPTGNIYSPETSIPLPENSSSEDSLAPQDDLPF